jgi:hypothetical protein
MTSIKGPLDFGVAYAAAAPNTKPLNLTRPIDFDLTHIGQSENGRVNYQDSSRIGAYRKSEVATEFKFLDNEPVSHEHQPMTKGEFVRNTRDAVEGLVGESGLRAVETFGGLAHIASGGKVSYDKKLEIEGFDSSSIKFEGSVKNGGRVGITFKASF